MKKSIYCIFVVVLCFLLLGACTPGEENTNIDYSVVVSTEGGMPLADIRVDVYKDSKMDKLVWAGETDEDGKISFTALSSDKYVATLKNVSDGYDVSESYQLKSADNTISLKTHLTENVDLNNASYELGSIVSNFKVVTTDGKEYSISELLEKNKAVVLNFWYLNCGPCKMEFPYLQNAYEEFSDEIEVLALNPVDGTNEKINDFANQLELTFPMAVADIAWEKCMKLSAYPTTVVIDRYGMISMIHKGCITEEGVFEKIFEYYASDDYKQTTVRNISEIE